MLTERPWVLGSAGLAEGETIPANAPALTMRAMNDGVTVHRADGSPVPADYETSFDGYFLVVRPHLPWIAGERYGVWPADVFVRTGAVPGALVHGNSRCGGSRANRWLPRSRTPDTGS